MPLKTTRKTESVETTKDGFTKMRLSVNLSLECGFCSAKPREFFWRSIKGKQTEVFCLSCTRENRLEK
jgi:hypothetical protein